MSFTSDEVNYLIYRYLQESGKRNAKVPPKSDTQTQMNKIIITQINKMANDCKRIIILRTLFITFCRLQPLGVRVRRGEPHQRDEHQRHTGAARRAPQRHPEGPAVHRGRDQHRRRK